MTKRATDSSVTQVTLTEEQRRELAATLNIDFQFIPTTLGVVAMPSADVQKIGFERVRTASFSPAMLMM